ncbi:cell division protein FtsQ [Anseongella ginsenosidimutans]|uniref:Cell division protein FtsQ n=1 Tax=Anseongella ginsenosidimutans TaxID=496056 RepID=A0A4R3L0E1_9SPHI|nr:cell division protein FtsQ [Anseongella ginsenosidimutans]QEC50974.1 cell division protein FtsQ [Anseongella ginsenosidimutans]TCS90380.1 cell division protein FtsQ [Anseongella ginsenosidimutans]
MKGRTLLKVFGAILLAAGLAVLMGFVHKKQAKVMCKSMEIVIPGEKFLVTREEIKALVNQADSSILWYPINYARLRSLEKAIRESPYVEDASVYADVDGVLKIEVVQREPLVRIINEHNDHFYVDAKGNKMPLSANYTPRVLVASGNIPESSGSGGDTLETGLAEDILTLARFISKDEFWKAQIGQVYVNQESEIELIPRVGNHRILLGNADNLEAKLEKLLIFYRKAMPRVGWDTYEVINLKYENQIVATRPEADSQGPQ